MNNSIFNFGLSIFFLLFSALSFAQSQNKNYLGLSLFKYEKNFVTINKNFEPKFFLGIEYERTAKIFKYRISFEHGYNKINDDCRKCNDHHSGIGNLGEQSISAGIKYSFFQKKTFRIKPFIAADAYLNQVAYEGFFSGGFSGGTFYTNSIYRSAGGLLAVGIEYRITEKFRCSLQSSIRGGKANVENSSGYYVYPTIVGSSYEGSTALVHFKIGYLF